MHYTYKEAGTDAILDVMVADPGLQRRPLQQDRGGAKLYTIIWNSSDKPQSAWVDEVEYPLAPNALMLLIVDHTYRFERPAELTAWRFNREFYCIIDHDAEVGCAGFLFYGFPSPMLLTPDEDTLRKIQLLCPVFVDEFETHDGVQGEMLRMLLKRLIIILTRLGKSALLPKQTAEVEYDVVRQFNMLVEKHFREKHQVADYAALMHKSPKTLSNLFNKLADKTPLQFIRERIALEAKRLLMYTDKSVSEIGYDLGFRESSHFSRFFKSVAGISPSAVRS